MTVHHIVSAPRLELRFADECGLPITGGCPELDTDIDQLRAAYPELAGWGDLALHFAWVCYSHDYHDTHWKPVVRDERFFHCILAAPPTVRAVADPCFS